MTVFLIIATILLLTIVIVQIGKVSELSAKIRGEEEVELRQNKVQSRWLLAFMVLLLIGTIVSAIWVKNFFLGYGPLQSASEHGSQVDGLFKTTLFFTGIVFILTQIALFYFSYKYYGKRGRKASFLAHNNTLEIVWSSIPAIVMTFLVVRGLIVWNDVMPDVGPNDDYIEIEATGYQFAWHLRYPGPDGALGARDYKLISGLNPLGQDWTDVKNHDDIHPDQIVLPVNKKVRVRITSRDVLHNFYLPHFRVKMDAVPGMPTYFIFTPTKTTEEFRLELSKYPEYQKPKDPDDPESPLLWEDFNYELACAELCGRSHYSMRRVVRIVTEEEYHAWLAQQNSYYLNSVRGSEDDPLVGQIVPIEMRERREKLTTDFESALAAESAADKVVVLDHVEFLFESAELTENSVYHLEHVEDILKRFPDIRVEIGGHTDNVGDPEINQLLSEQRAESVRDFLVSRGIASSRMEIAGYGETRPVDSNETDAGRQMNRRVELTIIGQ